MTRDAWCTLAVWAWSPARRRVFAMPSKSPALTRASPIEERAPAIINRLSKAHPDAHVALDFTNPLECLVATILSAQCTDERVNIVTKTLFPKYPTAEAYLKVPVAELASDIKSTGFFNQKTKSIRGACTRIVESTGGRSPAPWRTSSRSPASLARPRTSCWATPSASSRASRSTRTSAGWPSDSGSPPRRIRTRSSRT